MLKSQVDSVALVGAALAATLALTLLLGPFAWMASIIGLILLFILFAFDQEGYRTVLGSLAFSAVCGLSFALACGALFRLMAEHGEVHLADQNWATEWLPFAFLFGTVFLWAIDRSRMSARVPVADQFAARPGAAPRSFINYAEPAPAAAPAARFVAPEPAPVSTFAAAAAPEPHHTFSQPVAAPPPPPPPQPVPVYAPPPPPPPPPVYPPAQHAQPQYPQSMLTPPPSEPVRSAPMSIVSRPPEPPRGPETMIYVNLLGEGLNVMRSVRAEHLGRDYYRITDVMPDNENWQFQPGQVVRCKKQNLSTGKAMVAMEEAQRAQ